jgi:integrase
MDIIAVPRSMPLDVGVPPEARLGHEDPQTTLRVYARLAKASDVAAAKALG